jgi:hypothetical protein
MPIFPMILVRHPGRKLWVAFKYSPIGKTAFFFVRYETSYPRTKPANTLTAAYLCAALNGSITFPPTSANNHSVSENVFKPL